MPSRPTRPIIDRSLSLRWGDLSEKERDLVRTERGWMDRGENKTIRFDLIVLIVILYLPANSKIGERAARFFLYLILPRMINRLAVYCNRLPRKFSSQLCDEGIHRNYSSHSSPSSPRIRSF